MQEDDLWGKWHVGLVVPFVAPAVVYCDEESRGGRDMDIRERIELDPAVMGGRPCVRGTRVTVSTLIGLLAAGHERDEILSLYPSITAEDITAALSYAAWRLDEHEVDVAAG